MFGRETPVELELDQVEVVEDKQESPEAMSRYPGKVGETLCVSPRAARLRGGRYHIYNQGGA